MNRILIVVLITFYSWSVAAQSYAPAAGQEGTTAMHKDSSAFVAWASAVTVERGLLQIDNPSKTDQGSNYASFGEESKVIGKPSGSTTDVISLGDGGWAIVSFDGVIKNGEGFDFAVFENGVNDKFLELAFVEVSSDGEHFFRFPAHSETQDTVQVDSFGELDCRYLNNLAGKYRNTFGTPFDLDDIPDTSLLDKNAIKYVKIIDVIGTIKEEYASYDAFGNKINDPFPTPFWSSGFDLTGVGVIHFEERLSVSNATLEMVKVFPTKFTNKILIQVDSDYTYVLSTLEGKQITSGTGKKGTTELTGLEVNPGIYLLNISTEKSQKTFRLIK